MNKEFFQKTEKLYHYTSVAFALKILCSKSLRFSELKRMNDINEAHRNIFYNNNISETSVNNELNKYRQISLTRDNAHYCGYGIPAMWGHYAEKGNGVCLAFDKKKLLSLLGSKMIKGNIQYKKSYNGDILINQENIPSFFKKNIRNLFFTKTKDWSYEQEFRILTKTNSPEPIYLQYQDSIMAIIMNYTEDNNFSKNIFDSYIAKIFKHTFPDIPVLEFSGWFEQFNLRDENGNDWNCQPNYKIDL